jgi:hypothetical protein
MRKISIRTRKIRGDETLNGSMSCAMAGLLIAEACASIMARAGRKQMALSAAAFGERTSL